MDGDDAAGAESAGGAGAAPVLVQNVSKRFDLGRQQTVDALADVTLSISAGEFVALFGPSGCGKSTLLRLMAGLEEPTSGHVLVDGGATAQMLSGHRIGFAFQDHALLPWANVYDNIALPFRLAKTKVPRRRVEELIDLVGLTGFALARPKQLSGGMRQRVSIARALALSPDLLLLDEPFGALDQITRRRLNFELAQIWQETGVTTVLVTHSADEAVLLADRVVVMASKPGRISQVVDVDIPRPRDESIMTDPTFVRLSDDLVRTLEFDATGG